MPSLADRLRLLIIERGSPTQTEISRETGISQGALSRILRGERRNLGAKTIQRLERYFDAPGYLLGSPAETHEASLQRYLASDYGAADAPTRAEIGKLRRIVWSDLGQEITPRKWSKLLEALRS